MLAEILSSELEDEEASLEMTKMAVACSNILPGKFDSMAD